MERTICIHGHFYQPPRENPWLDEVELQDSAYPYHDWNTRITAQCYAPNTDSRILNYERKIIDIVCNYRKISFNFGPTLLLWLEAHEPEVYRAVIEADKQGQKDFSGHGPAIAQCYNHMIMPLANSRDRITQVRWGKNDFIHRFGREPEGMWLPETAVDTGTLEVMAEEGIRFTILSPYQASHSRRIGAEKWDDVSGGAIDNRRPYLCRLPSGRSITIFFYDGPLSRDVAFSRLLDNGENFAAALTSKFSGTDNLIENIATDGETYGHHHPFGDMALAYCVYHIESRKLARMTVYGEYLERNPPDREVKVFENSSWSCFHGIERWRSACGCNSGMNGTWQQAWRAPLRGALDWLRDNVARIYEQCGSRYVSDPWAMRDDYIRVILDRSTENINAFLASHAGRELLPADKVKVLKLLEMQNNAMRMYTSCGWFFDEISGIETVQVMMYAARALQLAHEVSGMDLEGVFTGLLERAPSNMGEYKNGRGVYESLVKPAKLDFNRVCAHYSISRLFKEYPKIARLYSFTIDDRSYEMLEEGRQRMAVGEAHIRSNIFWEEGLISYCVLHLGEHNVFGVVGAADGESAGRARQELKEAFLRGDISLVLQLMQKMFRSENYSLWHLFKDEQRAILGKILDSSVRELELALRQFNEHHFPVLQVMKQMNIPLPKIMESTEEIILNQDIAAELSGNDLHPDRLEALIQKAVRWKFSVDRLTLSYLAGRKLDGLVRQWAAQPWDIEPVRRGEHLLRLMGMLGLGLDLGRPQNIYFAVGKRHYPAMQEKAGRGDASAREWLERFDRFGDYLKVKIA